MNRIELMQVRNFGDELRQLGPALIDPEEIIAQLATDRYSVLYLRSGEKLLVEETLETIQQRQRHAAIERALTKRFKRELRESIARGMPVDRAFADGWEIISGELDWTAAESARLYQSLLNWAKRWLK